MAKKENKAEIERTYNVPLRSGFRNAAIYKKTPKAMRTLQAFLAKHMKTEDVRIGPELNKHIWGSGIRNPPHHVKVKVTKKDGIARAELEGFEYKEAVKAAPKEEKAPKAEKKEEPAQIEEVKQEPPKAEAPKKAPAKKKAAKKE